MRDFFYKLTQPFKKILIYININLILEMKKLILLICLSVFINSCSIDEEMKFHYVALPIESVEIPSEFVLGQTYQIIIKYYKPTTCYGFNGFYFEKDLNVRTIAVRTVIFEENTNCEATVNLFEENLSFTVTNNGNYIFKFWKGTNDAGEDIYLEYNIPVN